MSADEKHATHAPAAAGSDALPSVATLESLKARIASKLVSELDAAPKYRYEDYENIDLSQQGQDKAEKLLFGEVFEVENEWQDNDSDYHYNQDKTAAKEKLEELLDGEFEDDIEAVAERIGMEADELRQELLDDDAFEPQEIGWSGHYTKYSYINRVAACADLDVTIGIEPSTGMFDTLRLLRIRPKDFLSAVRSKMLSSGATADDAGEYELSDSEVELAQGSLYGAYRERFKRQLARYEIRYGACHEFTEPPVVDVHDLVTKILDEWSSPASLQLSLALDGSTVSDLSEPLCRMDSKHKATLRLRVTDGYISDDPRDYPGTDTLAIKAPFEVPRSAFKVQKDGPDRKMGGALSLAPRERGYSALYEMAYVDDAIKKLDRDDPRNRSNVAKDIARIVDALPAHALQHARDGVIMRNWGGEAEQALSRWVHEIATEAIDAREAYLRAIPSDVKGRELLSALNQVGTVDGAKDQAIWLIRNGADVNVAAANGVTPVLLAANLRDIELLSLLRDAGADLKVVRHAGEHGFTENALSLALRSGAKGVKKDGEPPPSEAAEWLVEHGVPLLNERALAVADDTSVAHPLFLALDCKDADLFSKLIEASARSNPAEVQRALVDDLFSQAVTDVLVDSGAALIEHGANLDLQVKHKYGQSGKGTIEEVLGRTADSSSFHRENCIQFQRMIQAARAKRSIEGVLQKARVAVRQS